MNKMKLIDASALEEHLYEEIKCGVLCTNTMRSDTGCDGGCHYDEDLFKKINDAIQRCVEWQPAVSTSSYTETMIVDGEKTLIDPVSYEVGYTHGQTTNKKGRWIIDRYCSECEWDKKDAELVCNIPTNYCPNCGADMRSDNK